MMTGDLLLMRLAVVDQTPLVMVTVVDPVILLNIMTLPRAQIIVVGGHPIDCHLHHPHLVLVIDFKFCVMIILIHVL